MKIFLINFILLIYCNIANASLRDLIHQKTRRGQSPLTYKTARIILFGKIYLQSNPQGDYIEDIYCHRIFTKVDGVGVGKIPNHLKINTEHAMPKIRFSKSYPYKTQKSDLFHLFPTANWANNKRGHLIFSNVEKMEEDLLNCPDSSIGETNTLVRAFEPPDKIKGDLARALFYFSIRYNVEIDDLEERSLRKWHKMDPVDEFEKRKNDLIEIYQGNRNPFIDRPDLYNLIKDY